MNQRPPYAWLDGEPPEDAARPWSLWLPICRPGARTRDDAIGARPDAARASTRPVAASGARRRPSRAGSAAAAALVRSSRSAACSGLPGWWPRQHARRARRHHWPRQGDWLQRAAVAHSVYVPGGAPPGRGPSSSAGRHLARWLTKRLEMPVKLFDLRAQASTGRRAPAAAKGPGAPAHVPGHRRSAGRPDAAARDRLSAQAGRRHAGRIPLRAARRHRHVHYWVEGASRPSGLRLCPGRQTRAPAGWRRRSSSRAAERARPAAGAGPWCPRTPSRSGCRAPPPSSSSCSASPAACRSRSPARPCRPG